MGKSCFVRASARASFPFHLGLCRSRLPVRNGVMVKTRSRRHSNGAQRLSAKQPTLAELQETKPTEQRLTVAELRRKKLKIKHRRIYILGIGNLGRLFAHALSQTPNGPPVTLLFHRESQMEEWRKAGEGIVITTNSTDSRSTGYDIEMVGAKKQKKDIIRNLIVATKTINTLKAVSSMKHRLSQNTTVLFTQNGKGFIEEIDNAVFPNPLKRPHYLTSITSHGLYSTQPFRSVRAGLGDIAVGRFLDEEILSYPRKNYLITRIVAAPGLQARWVSPQELLRLQLEKLVINAVINTFTVIFNCRNGELFSYSSITRSMRLVLQEASQVILSFPELLDDPIAMSQFSADNLATAVLNIANKTAGNTSSMLQDARAGRETEIDYINGYIIKKGKEHGIECKMNEKIVEMVKNWTLVGDQDIESS